MDKQEMVSDCCGARLEIKKGMRWDEIVPIRVCSKCGQICKSVKPLERIVPVCSDWHKISLQPLAPLPAQPELPRELPLAEGLIDICGGCYKEQVCSDGDCIFCQRQIKAAATYQQNEDQDTLDKWVKAHQQALKRIAELEAEVTNQKGRVTDLCSLFNDLERDTDKEIASLKEQLAVMENSMDKVNGELGWANRLCLFCHSDSYDGSGIVHKVTCPIAKSRAWGCPVPAKEEK